MPFGAAAILGGSSLLGSIFSSNAASDAANTQSKAATRAADLQLQTFNKTQDNLYPYLKSGSAGQGALNSYLGINADSGGITDPNAPLLQNPLSSMGAAPQYNMPAYDAAAYRQSPGYAFALQGGTDALTNAGAMKTGALSGNVLKALQGYGSGLANQDYQQNYQNYATDYQNQYKSQSNNYWNTYTANRDFNNDLYKYLAGITNQGENAAVGQGQIGTAAASNAGGALIGAGNARASGIVGSSNAITGGLNSLSTLLQSPVQDNSYLSKLFDFGGGSGYGQGWNMDYGGGGY